MSPKHYSILAAVIFTIVAIGQLLRAVVGLDVTLDGSAIPVWASWIAAVVGGGLAVLGFNASQRS
jgi:hypothetical protein